MPSGLAAQHELLIVFADALPVEGGEIAGAIQAVDAFVAARGQRSAQVDLIYVERLARLDRERQARAVVDLERETDWRRACSRTVPC